MPAARRASLRAAQRNFVAGCSPLLLTALALLTSCRTDLPPVDLAAPGWRVRHGQAIWKASANEADIAGELLLAVNADGRGLAQFSKSPFTLVDARFTPGRWLIEFPLRRARVSGDGWRLENLRSGEALEGYWTP